MVKAGRITQGRPIWASTCRASSMLWAMPERAESSPAWVMAARKRSRSSALRITSALAPSISIPSRSKTPRSFSASAVLSAVCPPRVGRTASGRSFSRIFSTASGVMGSM